MQYLKQPLKKATQRITLRNIKAKSKWISEKNRQVANREAEKRKEK